MGILCVAIVVLSLTSVSQSAPLTCEQLLKPLDKGPDFSGRWYFIALSASGCFFPVMIDVLGESIAFDFTSTSKPNIYGVNTHVKMYGYCDKITSEIHGSNVVYDFVDATDQLQLLQSGCPDCAVLRGDKYMSVLFLLSRRQKITDLEMKEFEIQMKCLDWSKLVVFETDHVYENCPSPPGPSDKETSELNDRFMERFKGFGAKLAGCVGEATRTYFQVACDWIKEMWNDLWS